MVQQLTQKWEVKCRVSSACAQLCPEAKPAQGPGTNWLCSHTFRAHALGYVGIHSCGLNAKHHEQQRGPTERISGMFR